MLRKNKKFNKNVISLLVCVAIAIGLWCYVAFVENPDMTRWITGVPITISGADALNEKGLSIQSISSERIDVKVRATRNQFRYLSSETITATADVSRISRTGSTSINITVSLPSSTPNASVVDRRKSSVTVLIEDFVEKEFEIEVNLSKEPANGYYIHSIQYDIESKITVSGTATAISSIDCVKTVPIDLSSATSNVVYPASLVAYDSLGKEVGGVSFSLEKINVTFELYHKKTVPVSISYRSINSALSASVEPSDVTIDGPSSVIDAIDHIPTEAIDALLLQDGDQITVSLSLPSSVSLDYGSSSTCKITFTSNE